MRAAFAGLLLAVCTVATAQEGFPLDGTWRGERVAADGTPRTIVMIIEWDGKTINGTINPGPQAVSFTTAELQPAEWKFTLQAASGKGEAIAFEGTLADIGRYDRTLTGKWSEGKESFDIRFVRE